MSPNDWDVGYILPNVSLTQAFEAPYIALVPHNDTRLIKIKSSVRGCDKLLNCFIDQANKKVEPSIIIVDRQAPKKVWTDEALVAFRNSIAMAVILRNWAEVDPNSSPGGPLFSDFFDFYPYTLGADGVFVALNPALSSIYSSSAKFVGMSAPHLPHLFKRSFTVDENLLIPLLLFWKLRFASPGKDDRISRVLFRSIEMAYHALSTPIKNQSTLHDYGISLAEWVSAFEILAHPKNATVDVTVVMNLLEGFSWNDNRLKYRRYVAKIGRTKKYRVNLICRLYKDIYDARNTFLHGNPVTDRVIYPFGKKSLPSLWQLAPVIYRVALMAFLERHVKRKRPGLIYPFIESHYEDCFLQMIDS